MRPVPVADGTMKADMPVKGKEQHGTVVVVRENINNRMNHAPKDKGQPPMSTCVGFVEEAPKQYGVDDEGSWGMQEVVTCNPERIVEVQVIEGAVHYAVNGLGGEIAVIDEVSDGKKEQGKVR